MARYTLKIAHQSAKVSKEVSKMPGKTYSVSAKRCNVGSKLAQIKGSVCSGCYALDLQRLRPTVDQGWEANYQKLISVSQSDPEAWIVSMVHQIGDDPYFRWFASGDLPSEKVLDMVVEVCRRTPNTKHWLPTKELAVVRGYKGVIPDNLIIRVSAPMINQKPVSMPYTSTVFRKKDIDKTEGWVCPSSKQGNSCGDCRACWDTTVRNITYIYH